MKNPERFESKKNEKIYGGKRTLIEDLFGNVKQKTTSHMRIFRQNIAEVFALLRLALYDMYLLTSFRIKAGVWVIFRTAPHKLANPSSFLWGGEGRHEWTARWGRARFAKQATPSTLLIASYLAPLHYFIWFDNMEHIDKYGRV